MYITKFLPRVDESKKQQEAGKDAEKASDVKSEEHEKKEHHEEEKAAEKKKQHHGQHTSLDLTLTGKKQQEAEKDAEKASDVKWDEHEKKEHHEEEKAAEKKKKQHDGPHTSLDLTLMGKKQQDAEKKQHHEQHASLETTLMDTGHEEKKGSGGGPEHTWAPTPGPTPEPLSAMKASVAETEEAIKTLKQREEEIKEYAPNAFRGLVLRTTEDDLAILETRLKALKKQVAADQALEKKESKIQAREEKANEKELEKEEKKDKNEKSSHHHHSALFARLYSKMNMTSTLTESEDSAETVRMDRAALLALEHSAGGVYWAKTGVCCAIGVIVAMFLSFTGRAPLLRRPTVNVDQAPLLG